MSEKNAKDPLRPPRRDPDEVLQSKAKSFRNFLELAHECLQNKDYVNAEMIYGSILTDLTKDYVYAAYDMNDLMVFSLHTCYAYCLVGINSKSEQAMILLSSLQKPTKLPLIQYLKAFVHVSNDHVPFAQIEIKICERLLDDGYDFTQHDHLNEKLIPELNEEFLKLKLNGLKLACDYLLAKENTDEQKENFKERWMKLGVLCECDFSRNEKGKSSEKKKGDKDKSKAEDKKSDDKKTDAKKTGKKAAASAKKNDSNDNDSSRKTNTIAIQTVAGKGVNAEVQTMSEKDANKNVLAALNDIKAKLNNLNKKDFGEIKQLQKKNNELCEKLAKNPKSDEKNNSNSAEFDFLKNQYLEMTQKTEQYQQQIRCLEKVLVEQMQHKYQLQKQHYLWLEERCNKKIEYLNDVQRFIKPGRSYGSEQVPQEILLWKNTLEVITGAKRHFEDYFKEMDDMVTASCYTQVKTNNWPEIPPLPVETSDIVHKYYKDYLQAKDYTYHQNRVQQPQYYNANGIQMHKNYNYQNNGYQYFKPNPDGKFSGGPPSPSRAPIRTFNGVGVISRPTPSPDNSSVKSVKTVEDTASGGYESEQELLEFLKSNFREIDDMLLLQSVYKVRDRNGGTLVGLGREVLVLETKKALARLIKSASGQWGTNFQMLWSSENFEGKLCCICLEDYNPENCFKLKCLHEFHKKCIADWLKKHNTCPICRVQTVIGDESLTVKA